MTKRYTKYTNLHLLPSYLGEEDLEIYIATEIDEMIKHFSRTLKSYQMKNNCLINDLKMKIELIEMQYQAFMKEIAKQPNGVFQLKEKTSLVKKLKELESAYLILLKALKKKLEQTERDQKSAAANTKKRQFDLNQKNVVTVDIIPTITTKINNILEQINEDINGLNGVKCENDKRLQKLKINIKNRIDPYKKNSDANNNLTMESAEKIFSEIER